MRTTSMAAAAAVLAAAVALAASREEAQARAEAWLSLVDNQKYGESWSESSSLFRSRVDEQKWIEMARGAREPLGSLTSRKLLTLSFATTLPGAPDGDYAVLRFQSSFARKASAVETVTLMMETGAWRSAGYFIK